METWLLMDIIFLVALAVIGPLVAIYVLFLKDVVPLRLKTWRLKKKNYLLARIITKAGTVIHALVQPTPAGRFEVELPGENGKKQKKGFLVQRQNIVYDPLFDIFTAFYHEDSEDPIPVEARPEDRAVAAQIEGIVHEVRRNALAQAIDIIPYLEQRLKVITILLAISLLAAAVAAGAAVYLLMGTQHVTAAATTSAAVAHAAKTAAETNAVVHV